MSSVPFPSNGGSLTASAAQGDSQVHQECTASSSGYDSNSNASLDPENSKKRRGKWTEEEERYVNRIVQDFELGLLNVNKGTSLRVLLSELLNCDPMRLTKKWTRNSKTALFVKRKAFIPAPVTVENYILRIQSLEQLAYLRNAWQLRLLADENSKNSKRRRKSSNLTAPDVAVGSTIVCPPPPPPPPSVDFGSWITSGFFHPMLYASMQPSSAHTAGATAGAVGGGGAAETFEVSLGKAAFSTGSAAVGGHYGDSEEDDEDDDDASAVDSDEGGTITRSSVEMFGVAGLRPVAGSSTVENHPCFRSSKTPQGDGNNSSFSSNARILGGNGLERSSPTTARSNEANESANSTPQGRNRSDSNRSTTSSCSNSTSASGGGSKEMLSLLCEASNQLDRS